MLIVNSTKQIAIPSENVFSVVVQPAATDPNEFYDKDGKHPTDLRDKPTNLIVTGAGITFTERYGNAEKAQAQMDRFKAMYQLNSRVFTFEGDPEYEEERKAQALKRAREMELAKPAYKREEGDGQKG